MKNPPRLKKMTAKQLVREAKAEFDIDLPEEAGRKKLLEVIWRLHDFFKDRPTLPNYLLEIELRSSLDPRMADHIIRMLLEKVEPHPEERPIIGLEAIGEFLGWKYEYTRKHSKELQDAKVVYWQHVYYKNQYRLMHYPSDLKRYIKRRRTKPEAIFRNGRLP